MLDKIRKYNFWDQGPSFNIFNRPEYLDKLASYVDQSPIKVLTGQRRVGKSSIMRLLIQHLIKNNISSRNIFYLNMEYMALDFIHSASVLHQLFQLYRDQIQPAGTIYLIIDEIQEIPGWEKFINSIQQDHTLSADIYITGSNSNLLSKELATYLAGRYVQIEVYPFSYREYLDFKSLDPGKLSLIDYMQNGGMPELLSMNTDEQKSNYLGIIKDTILLNDIVKRHQIRDVDLLEKLLNFTIDTIGSPFSLNKIISTLKSMGYQTNVETTGNYLKFMEDAYAIYSCERFDIKGKQILTGERKYYLNDTAIKYYLSSSFDFQIGRFLENIVFMELKRRSYNIYVGKIREKEIDFIAEKSGTPVYIQVSYLLSDDAVIEREFGNLRLISDNYKKIVLSMDELNMGNQNGIIHQSVWDFLLTN